VGLTLPIAAEVIAAHRGRIGSMAGATRRSAVAVALPLEP
jgi:signal transduction histidine kinase